MSFQENVGADLCGTEFPTIGFELIKPIFLSFFHVNTDFPKLDFLN